MLKHEGTLVLRGGRVIDPASRTDAIADVVVVDGLVAAVGPRVGETAVSAGGAGSTGSAGDRTPGSADVEVVDCAGLVVTPGLIDMHAHVYPGLGDFCVEPDRAGVRTGVPTVVDGGTSGVATFGLARNWLEASAPDTRVLAFIDPSQLYLATGDFICHKLRIADDERNLDLGSTAAALEAHADMVVGFKVRATHTGDDTHSPFLSGAQAVAGDLPVMVHLGRFPHTPTITNEALLATLRSGDIITHAFRAGGGQLDPGTGAVTPEFADAAERGVRLDVGHSATDFRYRTARRLFDAGYLPDSISTDLNAYNAASPVGSLPETMSKIWALGVELADVVARATPGPARSIRRDDELGSLAVGRSAEVSVLRVADGPVDLSDGHETITADRHLVPVGCVRAGRWLPTEALVPA
ncbi:MAG: amidohydrolase/deacetylase family metallohydrolase [Acidimicrobiales bacterium]|nr:amidohydrolase/deacetylase family metallohydrolase [Acidimicrobiales bacterium]